MRHAFAVTFSAPASALSPAAAPAARTLRRQRLVRKRFWFLLAAAVLVCLPLHPPVWHAALRTWLGWQARRHGCELTIAALDGGLFDTTRLHGVHCRQRGPLPADGSTGTDLFIADADLTLAWTMPWFQRPAPSWVHEIVLQGVRGRWDLHPPRRASVARPLAGPGTEEGGLRPAAIQGDVFIRTLGAVFPSFRHLSAKLWPETFLLRADDLRLERGRYLLHTTGLWLSGQRDNDGRFLAREVTIAGPGFENTLVRPHGQTDWKESRLTLSQLALSPDVSLVSATLDGSRLNRHRLDWECKLTALGGEARGQGTVDFSRERLGVDVAASLRGAAVRPLARLLGIAGPADGLIDQGNFTFRGDPENPSAAQMWLAAHSTDFRWGKRRWEDLELQAVVVNRRVQVHRLELRQSANRLSLSGECPLPPDPAEACRGADALRQWREGGFSCQIDARLEDLRALADLYGPQAPELAGRMSVNGTLSAQSGAQQPIDGYLNVEGSRLSLRGAPLDYLRSTLVFKDGGLRVADLQATHDRDYFTGTGSMRLDGPPRCEGELRAAVHTLAEYTPALAGLPLVDSVAGVTGLSALLRWDDSVLAFEECQGQLGGAACQVGGRVDLRDAANPLLDLSLREENVTLRDATGRGRVQADCALTVRGRVGSGLTLGGDVRLLGGELGAALELVPGADVASRPLLPLDAWLPVRWEGWHLDLRITAAAPLSLALGGEATPDLRVTTTTWSAPEVVGRVDLRQACITSSGGAWEAPQGTLYFGGSLCGPPQVALSVVGSQGEAIVLAGRYDQVRAPAGWGRLLPVDPAANDGLLRPGALPPLWAGDASPWLKWAAARTPPEYTLLLR